jgi:hypothetical protein
MAKFWQSQAFKNLEKEWYCLLKESGFKDAEKEVDGEIVLAHITNNQGHYTSNVLRQRSIEEVRHTQFYFELLFQKFHEEKNFCDNSDKLIMEKTAEGWTIKQISKELKRLRLKKYNRDTIRYIRRRYEHKWGMRQWKPEQMISRKALK